ncbi:MAG: DUF1517 domain-containing protein [Prochlorococcaceae cyanobacterium ETNP14_MAG_4]|nr:DUF1517 domain-containing protein [Prochlorococcaceae cyanobacterium ETNP14_MAG_4]
MFRRLLATLLLPFLMAGLILLYPEPSQAARGGRIGGGGFRAPSMPRSSGGYRGGYGGGYRGGYGGGYRGGGMGFPFIIPFFGFGGGGLFGFLILMSVVGILVNALRGGGGGGAATFDGSGELTQRPTAIGPVTMMQVQVGLLASAKALQVDLRQLAASAETGSSSGLQRVLQETTLALLRQPELWVYANIETGSVPFASAEATFNRLSMTERSKLQAEVTSNVSGERRTDQLANKSAGEADLTNEYIVVTILVASHSRIKLSESVSGEQLRESLRILGSTSSTDLIALEVIWQPEGRGDVLSAEEVVTSYPNLQHL